jgi:hypothetical protein
MSLQQLGPKIKLTKYLVKMDKVIKLEGLKTYDFL